MVRVLASFVVLVGILLVSCGGGSPVGSTRIVSFEASATTVERGASITLTWNAEHVGVRAGLDSCSITRRADGEDTEEPFPVSCGGSLSEVPPAPSTSNYIRYQLNVLKHPYDHADPYITQVITIDFLGSGEPTRIVTFEASATTVERGESITLSWKAEHVGVRPGFDSCSITRRAEGEEAEEPFPVACEGSLSEVPPAPSMSSYVRYQFNVLKQPHDPSDPYLMQAIVVSLAPPLATDLEVDASLDSAAPVAFVEVGAGETRRIRVNVPPAQRGQERRIVVEVDDDEGVRQLDLVLYEEDGITATASTSGAAFFRPGLEGIGIGFVGTASDSGTAVHRRGAPGEVHPSVTVVAKCFGPCISSRADASVVYVEVTNAGSFPANIPFFAYTQPWNDEGEPQNDSLSGAISLSTIGPYRGAIERLHDLDFVRFAQDGLVVFDERSGYDVSLVLDLFTASGVFIEQVHAGGAAFLVYGNEYARIRSDPSAPRATVYGFYDVYYVDD